MIQTWNYQLPSKKKIDIKRNLKQLIDLTFTTNEEHVILELDQDVNYLLIKFRNIICTNGINLLPKEETKKKKKVIKRCDTSINCEIPPPKKIPSPRELEVWLIWWFSFIEQKLLWQFSLRKGKKLQILK